MWAFHSRVEKVDYTYWFNGGLSRKIKRTINMCYINRRSYDFLHSITLESIHGIQGVYGDIDFVYVYVYEQVHYEKV